MRVGVVAETFLCLVLFYALLYNLSAWFDWCTPSQQQKTAKNRKRKAKQIKTTTTRESNTGAPLFC